MHMSIERTINDVVKKYAEEDVSTPPKDAIDGRPSQDNKNDGIVMPEPKRKKGDPSRHWSAKGCENLDHKELCLYV